jgi:capsular polysaccharide biosynthesis protein
MKKLTYKGSVEYRNRPENFELQDTHLFQHEFQKAITDSFVTTHTNIYSLKKNLINGKNFKLYLDETYMNKPTLKNIIKVGLNFLKLRFKPISILDSGVWIINNKSENYFHWMTESLSRVLSFQRLNKKSTVLLSEQFNDYEFVSKTLDILDIDYKIYSNENLVKVRKLFLTTHTATAGNYNSEIILEIQNKLNKNTKSNKGKRIWLSRRFSDRRFLSNEEELTSVLDKYNIEVIYPENMSYFEQIEIYRKVEFIGGVHGAAMVNMLYMEMGGKVLELRYKNDSHNNCYYSLSVSLKHKYFYQKCEMDLDDNLIADPNQLNIILKEIFND